MLPREVAETLLSDFDRLVFEIGRGEHKDLVALLDRVGNGHVDGALQGTQRVPVGNSTATATASIGPESVIKKPACPVEKEAKKEGDSDWKVSARAIADKLFDHDTNSKTRDSLDGYAKRVMEKMQEGAIHGPRGRFDNHNTIKREALQGSKWWRRKPK